jgi:colanic acid/amylovoran biosynthesis glycosyltransferase
MPEACIALPPAAESLTCHLRSLRVAYIMSRFPKLTETFILNEILQQERLGVLVEVYPLLRERCELLHPEAQAVVNRAHYHAFLSWRILRAHAHFLRHRPLQYLRVLWDVLRGTFGSWNFFVGAIGIFPKSVFFARDMQRRGVQHVHAHFATHPAVAAFIVHRLTGIPFSFTAHGSDLHVDRRMLPQKLQAAAFAVTVSDFNRQVMAAECGEHARPRIHIVHCGVDTRFFRQGKAREFTAGRHLRVVCTGSFEEVKGHSYLIEACRILRDRSIPVECHLIGDGPLRRALEQQIQDLSLGPQVRLHGALPRWQVARMLREADVFALTSVPTAEGKREGIPVAIMEAMSCELPVVASRLSGIPELVEDGVSGILVPTRDSRAIADALQLLFEHPQLRRDLGRRKNS